MDNEQGKLFFCNHLSKNAISNIMLCLFFPSVFLGVKFGDTLFLLCAYGFKAYANGLRFQSSKHGLLNNGEQLAWYINIPRGTFDFILVFALMITGLWICNLLVSRKKRLMTKKQAQT